MDALFRAMVPELKNKLNNGLTDFSKRRVNAVLKQTEEVIDRYYGMMTPAKIPVGQSCIGERQTLSGTKEQSRV